MLSAGARVGNALLCEQENQDRLWAGWEGCAPSRRGLRTPARCSPAAPAPPAPPPRGQPGRQAPGSSQLEGHGPRIRRGRWPQRCPGTRRLAHPRPRGSPSGPTSRRAAPGPESQPVSMATGQTRPGQLERCPVRAPLPKRAPRVVHAGSPCPGAQAAKERPPRPPLLPARPALTSSPARCRRRGVPAQLPLPPLA